MHSCYCHLNLYWGTCLLQSWILGFNPDNPNNLSFLTWVSLKILSYKQYDQAYVIVESLGEVISSDTTNETSIRFCVNLKVDKGWVTNIVLSTKEAILPTQHVLVDYDNLPFWCKGCLS